MSTRQYLVDAATRHQVFLQRYGGRQSKDAISALRRLRRDINARLSQEPTVFQRGRLGALLNDIDGLIALSLGDLKTTMVFNAHELAIYEAEFSQRLFNRATKANFILPSDSQLINSVDGIPMSSPAGMGGIKIADAFDDFTAKQTAKILQQISDGVSLGDTTPQIASKLGETMETLTRRQLNTLARTITNHASSVARAQMYEENSDIIEGYVWISTLDSRTTLICASRDQEVYQQGIGPLPPAHWGCRSTTIPKVKREFDLGAEIEGQRAAKGAAGGDAVSGNLSYGGWLKKQPVEFVDEALGVERSRLFRAGKLSIDKFVDPTGRVYTLEQLRRMYPFALQEQ